MNKCKGPYEFGSTAPTHLMGWNKEQATVDNRKLANQMPYTNTPYLYSDPNRKLIWTIVKEYHNAQHLPTFEQEVGDCVGAGAKQMGDYLNYVQIGRTFRSEYPRPWHASWIYGMSRVSYTTSASQSDGSTGRAAALVIKNAGVYFEDWPNAEPYSGELSRKWGEEPGPPQATRDLARHHLCINVEQITTAAQIRQALLADKMITIASMRGFEMEPDQIQGFHVFKPAGRWAHQMCIIDWMDHPFPAAYRLNSWGPNAHGSPMNGEPPGGAWNLMSDLENELTSSSVECFAFSAFEAWPTKANYNFIPNAADVSPPLPYK